MNTKIILTLILAAAFIVRIIGIGYGLPQEFVADEFLMVAVSLKMLDQKAWRPYYPDIFYHQPLTAYISLFGIGAYLAWEVVSGDFGSLAALKEFYAIHSSDLLIVVRFLSAVFGSLTVLLLYFIGRDLFSKRAGILAALFGAFELLMAQFSQVGRVWSFLTFFIVLAFWFSIQVFRFGRLKDYLKSALASGAAIMALLPGILVFLPALIARKFSLKDKKIWLAGGIVFLGIILAVFLNPRGLGVLLQRFDIQIPGLTEAVFKAPGNLPAIPPQPFSQRIFDAFVSLFNYAPIYFILFFVGLVILWRIDKRKLIFVSSFPAAYYLFIGPVFSYGERVRTVLPIMPFLVLVAAFTADYFLAKKIFAGKRFLSALFILAISFYSIYFTAIFGIKVSRADTRTQAIDWIYKNLPENSRILVYSLSNDVVNQNREVLKLLESVAPEDLNTRQRTFLSVDDSKYPKPEYFAWDLRKTPPEKLPPDFFRENRFRYLMQAYWGAEDGAQLESRLREKKLITSFKPFTSEIEFKENFANNVRNPAKTLLTMERFGPIVEIYEISFK